MVTSPPISETRSRVALQSPPISHRWPAGGRARGGHREGEAPGVEGLRDTLSLKSQHVVLPAPRGVRGNGSKGVRAPAGGWRAGAARARQRASLRRAPRAARALRGALRPARAAAHHARLRGRRWEWLQGRRREKGNREVRRERAGGLPRARSGASPGRAAWVGGLRPWRRAAPRVQHKRSAPWQRRRRLRGADAARGLPAPLLARAALQDPSPPLPYLSPYLSPYCMPVAPRHHARYHAASRVNAGVAPLPPALVPRPPRARARAKPAALGSAVARSGRFVS
jgi:hypothetical protein